MRRTGSSTLVERLGRWVGLEFPDEGSLGMLDGEEGRKALVATGERPGTDHAGVAVDGWAPVPAAGTGRTVPAAVGGEAP